MIDPDQPLPVYVQLKTLLLEEIVASKYGSDGQLPTEYELCERYGISRTPVHRALAELADLGVILRQRRRGSFVNPHWVQSNRRTAELRVVVPEGPWEELVRDTCPAEARLNVVEVALEDLHDVLVRAVAEGRAPDVALLDSVWVSEFAGSGFLLALEDLDADWLTSDYLADVSESFRAANRYGGRTYAVQAEADVAGLWYRRDVLQALGLEPPRTWAEMSAACRRLLDRGFRHPLAMPAGSQGGEATTYCLLALMAANGATAIECEEVTVDSPATRECLEFLHELVEMDALSVNAVSYEHDRASRLLAREQAVMTVGGSYELRALARETSTSIDLAWQRFGFAPPPQGPRGGASTLAGGMVHGIFRQAQQPHLAMQLLQRLSSTTALARMAQRTGQLACRRSAAGLTAPRSEFLRSTGAMLDGAVVRPASRTYPQVSRQLQAMLEAVLVGRLLPAAAASRAAEHLAVVTGLPPRSVA